MLFEIFGYGFLDHCLNLLSGDCAFLFIYFMFTSVVGSCWMFVIVSFSCVFVVLLTVGCCGVAGLDMFVVCAGGWGDSVLIVVSIVCSGMMFGRRCHCDVLGCLGGFLVVACWHTAVRADQSMVGSCFCGSLLLFRKGMSSWRAALMMTLLSKSNAAGLCSRSMIMLYLRFTGYCSVGSTDLMNDCSSMNSIMALLLMQSDGSMLFAVIVNATS